ncbi:MAG: hypothetical protein KGR26_11500, partial [Cyanobacteria bacterium REEB65]|nr:hypothetical protein [Cyanobacteria bacterium REEB65]
VELQMFPADVDRRLLVPVVADIYDTQLGKRGRLLGMAEILDRVSDVLYRYPFRLPERFSSLMRTVGTMEGVVLEVWPTFRFLDIGMPYAAKLLLTVADPLIRRRLAADLMPEGLLDLDKLKQTLEIARHEATFEFSEFLPEMLAWLQTPDGLESLRGFLAQLHRIRAQGEMGAALASILHDMDDLALRSGLESALDGAVALLERRELDLQPVFDWLAEWLAGAPARVVTARLGALLVEDWNPSFLARASAIADLALVAGLDLRPLVRTCVDLWLAPEGDAWRQLGVEIAFDANDRLLAWNMLYSLVARDGVGLDLLAGAVGGALLALLPQGQSMRRKAFELLARRLPRWS